ncbi:Acyltransferase ChoActase COT CPT domain containing protein [Aphelenchoides besseyi]|nr:Acyltransferase ChoActase COT CPT domain containing protein [Aphelenchoides besseyi]
MAEARSLAALSISLTHDGISVSFDQELLRDIWHAFSRGYKKRFARFKTEFQANVFPANLTSLIFVLVLTSILYFFKKDVTYGLADFFRHYIFYFLFGETLVAQILGVAIAGTILWFGLVQVFRLSIKFLLCYKGWMYESVGQKISRQTQLWFQLLHLISRFGPMLHSFQGALPHLPLPSLDSTLAKHLRSMRPILNDEEYNQLVEDSEKFRKGLGRRLQRYLVIKSYLSVNYVTDWWEEFVYLRQRSPIMINSNYYGFDTLNENPTKIQAARAANVVWGALLFRRLVERQEISPFAVAPRIKVPFCTMQYTRLFNSCRVPGEETDRFRHWDEARHIAVYCRGCWFKLPIHNGKRLLEPPELQLAFQEILDSELLPAPGEERLAALTAGERTHWALTRRKFFGSGVNKTSLQAIERAAFVVSLDDENVSYDPEDRSKLDRWAESLLHGNAHNIWFDKTFNLIVYPNGRVGVNAEHSFADASIVAHLMEYVLLKDYCVRGYDEAGNCTGEAETVCHPERLKWALGDEVQNQAKFSLTYEASMTRLFREGRTETVRSCTLETCDFVRAMLDPEQTREERLRLLRIAAERHQQLYRDAMCGQGIDRHLFALYVVQRYLEESSPFMDKIMPPTYLLSTSQTPMSQCEEEITKELHLSASRRLNMITAGGGFGPVSDKGYVDNQNSWAYYRICITNPNETIELQFQMISMSFLRRFSTSISNIHISNKSKWPSELLKSTIESCSVTENFVTEEEEQTFFNEIEPHMRRLRYERAHWDNAIYLYREREQKTFSPQNSAIVQRILEFSFPSDSRKIPYVHLLDLHEDGHIKPHIDATRVSSVRTSAKHNSFSIVVE